jgi:iron(III) transport system ATP-binding protein
MSLSADRDPGVQLPGNSSQTPPSTDSASGADLRAHGVPVRIHNLVKRFGAVLAVDNVSFEVEPSTTVSLLGPSGCGKTTTLRCIAGLEVPSSGQIRIGDNVVYDGERNILIEPEKRNIGMVFQSYAIWPHMTVGGNVGFPLRIARRPRSEVRERVARILKLVGLGDLEKRSAAALSGGQQQRVALARALIYEPRVVLFDEPLSNLDANLRERMRSELKLLQEQLNFTAIFVTHDQQEALALSDNVVLMRSGSIEQQGTPEEVFKDPRSLFAAQFLGYANHFAGTISTVDGELSVTIDLDAGIRMQAVWRSPISPQKGDQVVVAVRGDRVGVRAADGAADTALIGQVEVASFLGTHINYVVKVGELTFNVEASADDVFARGNPVAIELMPNHCHAYLADDTDR